MKNLNKDKYPWPVPLKMLFDFLNTADGYFIDFQIVDDENNQVCDLLSSDSERYFIPIGKQSSQSLICYWQYAVGVPINQLPIVWLDSEGSPNSVFASTADDFLSLLPYDTGGIYDFITAWEYHNSEPETYVSPLEEYDSSALQSITEACQENYADYSRLIDWLDQDLNIKICQNPAQLVGTAMSNFPNLEHWLREKGISAIASP